MFGLFSLPKLLLTVAIIVVVWQGFKWLNNRQAATRRPAPSVKPKNKSTASSAFSEADVEEMVPCPDCGAYVAKGGRHRCG